MESKVMTTEEAIKRFGNKVDCVDEGAGTCRQLTELCEFIEKIDKVHVEEETLRNVQIAKLEVENEKLKNARHWRLRRSEMNGKNNEYANGI
jgi:hypothetical protein